MPIATKIAFITGSAQGLGQAIAFAMAADGYDIALHYRSNETAAEETAAVIRRDWGRKCLLLKGNLADEKTVAALFNQIGEAFGRLDVLVQNVGNYLKKNILDLTPGEWNYILDTNLQCTFYCNRLAAQMMIPQKEGRIINIGYATAGKIDARPLTTPYHIAKTGVLLLTKALSAELASHQITVNMVSPGVLENSLSKPLHEIPMGRLGSFGDIIGIVRFLVSDKANYITGQHIEAAGGWRV